MSIQDERDLRSRLGGLLDGVEAAPAPVARAIRRGKVIRMRRWVAAAAGVAVIAAGAVVLPRLIGGNHTVAPIAPRHYKVTVQDLGPTAKGGVIAAGTIDNKHWRIVINKTADCIAESYTLICGTKYSADVGPDGVNLGGSTNGGTQFQFGPVGRNVTRVVIQLSNGSQLDLHPISALGRRWVAFAAPARGIVEAKSFVGNSEYQYGLPFATGGYSDFVTWLRPGQAGLPRASAQVGSGNVQGVTWQGSVSIGPWGYCAAAAGGTYCIPTTSNPKPPAIGKPLLQLGCAPLYTDGNPAKQIGAVAVLMVPAGVKNLVLKFADGSHLRLVATYVGGTRVIAYGLPKRPKAVGALEYGFPGQLVGSTSADWMC